MDYLALLIIVSIVLSVIGAGITFIGFNEKRALLSAIGGVSLGFGSSTLFLIWLMNRLAQ